MSLISWLNHWSLSLSRPGPAYFYLHSWERFIGFNNHSGGGLCQYRLNCWPIQVIFTMTPKVYAR